MLFLVIGILTLLLTGFMLIYYAYLFRNTDHDVSFFISIGIIAMIMNLFTNSSAGAMVLSVVYLIVAVAFIALGWAVDVDGSKAFYRSIAPFFKEQLNAPLTFWKVLSFALPPVGIVSYFVFYKSDRERALACGNCGLWGLVVWVIFIWAIVGSIQGINALNNPNA